MPAQKKLHKTLTVGALVLATSFVPTVTAEATTPGRNGLVGYTVETDTDAQLYTLDPLSGAIHQITHTGAGLFNGELDWSASGWQILYSQGSDAGGSIFLARADGTHPQALPLTGIVGQPAFVPHSHQIVYERYDPITDTDDIWIADLSGRHEHALTHNPYRPDGFDTDPNVSPDGRTVSFVRIKVQDDQQALFSVRVDGSHLRQLTSYSDDIAVKHDWSPDGTHIMVSINANVGSNPTASAEVMTVRADGSQRRVLTPLAGRAINAFAGSYSPDGRWIVYRLETGSAGGTLPDGKFGLYAVHPWGGPPRLLAALDGRPRSIDWGSSPGEGRHRQQTEALFGQAHARAKTVALSAALLTGLLTAAKPPISATLEQRAAQSAYVGQLLAEPSALRSEPLLPAVHQLTVSPCRGPGWR